LRFGWHLPALFEASVIVVLGLVMLGVAMWRFAATE